MESNKKQNLPEIKREDSLVDGLIWNKEKEIFEKGKISYPAIQHSEVSAFGTPTSVLAAKRLIKKYWDKLKKMF